MHTPRVQLVPTINGYKRLVGGEAFWAPNAVTYGYDSRAGSIRIISPPSVPPSATRFEVRVPGADMNPYFALSAIFALGLRGIEKKLELNVVPVAQMTQEDKRSGKVCLPPYRSSISGAQVCAPIGYDVASIARSSNDPHDETRKCSERSFRRRLCRTLWRDKGT